MNEFEDFKINVKIKLSALWTSVMFCYIYGDYFELYVPKKIEGMIGGSSMLDTPMKLFAASLLLAISTIMIFLSVALKPRVSRALNIGLGSFYTIIMVLIGLMSVAPWRTFYVFLAAVESIITAGIVWYAWTWPKRKVGE